MSTDSYLIVFTGILVSDIIYQTGLIQRLSIKLERLLNRISRLEEDLNKHLDKR